MQVDGFQTVVSHVGDETVVALSGELDVASSGALNMELTELIDSGTNDLVIDLHELAFIDSTGLSAILLANKKLQGRGSSLILRKPAALVRQVFEVTGLTGALQIES